MGNVCDDGGWLHLAAPQAEYDNQDAVSMTTTTV